MNFFVQESDKRRRRRRLQGTYLALNSVGRSFQSSWFYHACRWWFLLMMRMIFSSMRLSGEFANSGVWKCKHAQRASSFHTFLSYNADQWNNFSTTYNNQWNKGCAMSRVGLTMPLAGISIPITGWCVWQTTALLYWDIAYPAYPSIKSKWPNTLTWEHVLFNS